MSTGKRDMCDKVQKGSMMSRIRVLSEKPDEVRALKEKLKTEVSAGLLQ